MGRVEYRWPISRGEEPQPAVGFHWSGIGHVPDAECPLTGFQRPVTRLVRQRPRRGVSAPGGALIPSPRQTGEDEAILGTVDQAHGAVPRALADIIGVLSVCRRWIPDTPSAMSTTR
jgi:hypothetical protein